MSFSVESFLENLDLNEKVRSGILENSERSGLGEFIAIYDGDERYSRNTVVSADLVKKYDLDKFDWITFDSRSGVVYALFFTEEFRKEKEIPELKSISLHEKHDNGREQAFHGNVPLRNFNLDPPVRFAIKGLSYTDDDSLILALHPIFFVPFQHISVQVGNGYYAEI